ncbi:MAG: DUF3365 domain-containing protein [Cyanobacteria bacterium P01_H01_bin.58]
MLNRLKLAPKFTVILLLIFVLGSALGGMVLSQALQQRAEARITAEGIMLMESMQAVRRYTDQQVRPLLEAKMTTSDDFWPEMVPAYSSRRVFEILQEQGDLVSDTEHIYKEAVLNPTNPDDLVDDFETSLVNDFLANPNTKELSGFRELPQQGLMFYSALPIIIKNPSCLECHSTPEAAPEAMLAQYGSENGFNWELNEVLGTQIVYVPAAAVFDAARQAVSSVMTAFFGVFAIALLCINRIIRPLVLRPIQDLARIAQKLANDDIQSETDLAAGGSQKLARVTQRQDELGQLGRIFQQMVNEVVARQEQLRQQIRQLTIEIDEKRKNREVEEIVETDYFQSLQQKAREIRDRRQT